MKVRTVEEERVVLFLIGCTIEFKFGIQTSWHCEEFNFFENRFANRIQVTLSPPPLLFLIKHLSISRLVRDEAASSRNKLA